MLIVSLLIQSVAISQILTRFYSVYSYQLKFSEPCQVHFVSGSQNSQLLPKKKQSKNMITEWLQVCTIDVKLILYAMTCLAEK